MDMTKVVNAINSKNTAPVQSDVSIPKAQEQSLEAIANDNNAEQTPQTNAEDIDQIVIAILLMEKVVENMATRLVEIERQHAVLVEIVQGGQEEPVETPVEVPVEEVTAEPVK